MKRKLFAIFLILAALLSSLAELFGGLVPTFSKAFTIHPALGWVSMLLLSLLGIYLLTKKSHGRQNSDLAQKWRRFKSIKRGYYSLLVLGGLVVLAGLDQVVIGKRALVVLDEGHLYFPAFTRAIIPGQIFGMEDNAALTETNYAALKQSKMAELVIMPLIPFSPHESEERFPTKILNAENGLLMDEGTPYNGYASHLNEEGQEMLRLRFRQGLIDGPVQGWDETRRLVYNANYLKGQLIKEEYQGENNREAFLTSCRTPPLQRIYYHPAPPLTGGHLLGTNSQGCDIAAYLYAGMQVNIQAILFYLPIVYAIGLSIGMMMGYFGGGFDLLSQRIIEIVAQLPFLFVVMILADFIPAPLHGMLLILILLALFGWMPMTYLIRTSTMKEKQRDYIAAARVMGAGSGRILFTHILPNLTPIIITLLPFSIASVILALTSLDYLGFGLPEQYASWGRLLNDGLDKISSPWVLSSAFCALVFTLILVNFVGEAIREAFDPRRHSYYR